MKIFPMRLSFHWIREAAWRHPHMKIIIIWDIGVLWQNCPEDPSCTYTAAFRFPRRPHFLAWRVADRR